jgi:hypothetical protein
MSGDVKNVKPGEVKVKPGHCGGKSKAGESNRCIRRADQPSDSCIRRERRERRAERFRPPSLSTESGNALKEAIDSGCATWHLQFWL